MLKLISNTYGSFVDVTSFLRLLTKEAILEFKVWFSERKDVRSEIKKVVNLNKVTYLLDQMESIRDMDVPQASKDLAIAKLQALLSSELTAPSSTDSTD
jgi:hypothetical protein